MVKPSLNVALVLRELLGAPDKPHYGYELVQRSGISAGSLYPVLARLEADGWVVSRWEAVDPEVEGRPRRKYYQLTPAGVAGATSLLRDIVRQLRLDADGLPGLNAGMA